MGTILLGYDGSEASKKAIDKVVSLLKPQDELIVVSIVPLPTLKEFAEFDPELSKARALESVNSAIANLKERGLKVIGLVREGDIAEEILKLGNELNCDLIALGDRGLSKVSTFALGSVTEKVMRYAKKPVLVVK
ncbi:MAG: universal stress protein [Candidatus Thermoplasmatota archaeon]|nr:universal stress protein [Candidatus Thermoplasmatota archaeon]